MRVSLDVWFFSLLPSSGNREVRIILVCSCRSHGRKGNLKTYLAELAEFLTGHPFPLGRAPHPIITPLHQPSLQLDRILNLLIAHLFLGFPFDRHSHTLFIGGAFDLQALQHGMKPSIISFRQQ